MESFPQLGLVALLIAINAFFAASEIALVSSDPVRLETLAKAGNRPAARALKLTRNSTRFLATIQVGITLSAFFTSAAAAVDLSLPVTRSLEPLLGPFAPNVAFVLVTVAVSLMSLIFGELVPKRLALRHAEVLALQVAAPLTWLGRSCGPLVQLLTNVTDWVLSWFGKAQADEATRVSLDELKALIEAAREGGTLGEQERRMILGVVGLSRLTARAVMVPRVHIQAISIKTTLAEAYNIAAQNAHTRLLVYDQDIDHVKGILHVKDLVWPLVTTGPKASPDSGQPPSVRELMRPVRFVPEYKLASDILREMQKNRLHLVVVTDEYGGTAGLITLEDLLEEIVGEIRDEYDAEEEAEFLRLGTHKGIFNVRASLARVNNELSSDLPRDQVATLAGLFLSEFNRLPEPGGALRIDNVELLVLEDGQRIQVTYTPPTQTEEIAIS